MLTCITRSLTHTSNHRYASPWAHAINRTYCMGTDETCSRSGSGIMLIHGYNLQGARVYVNGFPGTTDPEMSDHRTLWTSVPSLRNFDMEGSEGRSWITLDNDGRVTYVVFYQRQYDRKEYKITPTSHFNTGTLHGLCMNSARQVTNKSSREHQVLKRCSPVACVEVDLTLRL